MEAQSHKGQVAPTPPGWERVSKALQRPKGRSIVLLDRADGDLLLLTGLQVAQIEVRAAPDAVYRLAGGSLTVQAGTVGKVEGVPDYDFPVDLP